MKLIIGNMVCNRCVMVVDSILKELGVTNYSLFIGYVLLTRDMDNQTRNLLGERLAKVGFELVEDRLEKIIHSIKARIARYIDEGCTQTMSSYITDAIFYEYSYLSDLFSRAENKTIEHYFIEMRIDRAKEQLKYSDRTLTEIAYKLGFSSPQHFANQFKQYIGMSPSGFRKFHI